jgi:SAM-dependent methyltransferase
MKKLDLCCSSRKPEGYIGIDIIPFKGVDKVHDLNNGIPFPDEMFDEVRAHDAIEHIKDGRFMMREIWRVLKPNGRVDILVPSTDGRGAFQDLTHVSFWNENSFKYWTNDQEWMDYYRGVCLFYPGLLYTGPMSEDRVCHVGFVATACKNQTWLDTYYKRNIQ